MANSAVTVTVTDTYVDGKMLRVFGTIAIAAGDYPAGGYTLPLTDPLIKAQRLPRMVLVFGKTLTGYVYQYIFGTTVANGKLAVLVGAVGPLADGPTPTPAAVVADKIGFEAVFLGQN